MKTLASLREGFCVQVIHVGSYADEPRTLETMRAFLADRGYVREGKYHEIHPRDPRRAGPENRRTILRHPAAREKRLVSARTKS